MSSKVERGRTLARSQALQILFQAEVLDLSVDDVLAGDYLVSKGPLDPYAVVLARGCHDDIDRIDYALHSISSNWSLYRMPSTDRNLLRIAVFEMRFLKGEKPIDDAVVINEAVEIAKAYGTDESSRFVNGVLGRIARMESLPEPPVEEEPALDEEADAVTEPLSLDGEVADPEEARSE
ncbi:MAG: transcription antitermination factor NusB [Collinsella sp.]|nr:transcription antitermination factor NusB [Collinsella sp.]